MAYDKFAAVDSSTLLFPPTVRANLARTSANAVINGGFDIWQRGTSFSSFGGTNIYTADRFYAYRAGLASGMTVSRQATSLTGFQYCARVQRDSGNTSTGVLNFLCDLESVNSIPFAGQTVTFSFYARAGANYSSASGVMVTEFVTGTGTDQALRSGYTGTAVTSTNHTLTTSWARYSVTVSVASTATQIGFVFKNTPVGTAGAADYFDITGVQLEAGAVATSFRRNANSIQGELAACQRYYYRTNWPAGGTYGNIGLGAAGGTTQVVIDIPVQTTMRTVPTSMDTYGNASGGFQLDTFGAGSINSSSLTFLSYDNHTTSHMSVQVGATGLTQFRTYRFISTVVGNGLGFSAEL